MATQAETRKAAEQQIAEKEKRIMDAIRMKIPDRVPVICSLGYFVAKYTGIPSSAAYYDFPAWLAAYKKTIPDFPADLVFVQGFTPGTALEILKPHSMRWPGFNLDKYSSHQSVEVEGMKADEYDAFLQDSSDFKLRINFSRAADDLAGLAELPKISEMGWGSGGAQQLAMALSSPKIARAVSVLQRTGREMRKYQRRQAQFAQMLLDMGVPQYTNYAAMPPYDLLSFGIRGMSGLMTDMFRQPDKVLAACDKILQVTLDRPDPKPNQFRNIRVFMTVTRGSDNFLSKKQFDRFYWPTFRKLVHTLIGKGMTPCIFFEGNCDSRMEYLLEFPKGSMLVHLDWTDIFRAKDILRDHLCIQGNVPSTLLQTGTVQDVKDYCKKLIDYVGKGGGFILSPRSSTESVKPANLKAMIEFTKEYGVYR
jgi:hypothetical protein